MRIYYVGISISELQHWIVNEVLTLPGSRIFASLSPVSSDSSPDTLVSFFSKLPDFASIDHAGVIIAQLSRKPELADDPVFCTISMDCAQQFIPLTNNARSSLSINWQSNIKLAEAYLETSFLQYIYKRKAQSAVSAGNAFVECLFQKELIEGLSFEKFHKGVFQSLLSADGYQEDEIYKQTTNGSWILCEALFRYSRTKHEIMEKPASIRSILDTGVILRESGKYPVLIDQFSAISKQLFSELPNHKSNEFDLFYSCKEIQGLSVNLYSEQESSNSTSIFTASTFLHWRETFHDNNKISLEELHSHLEQLSKTIPIEQAAEAVWLFGAYLGWEYIGPIYRSLKSEKYPALILAPFKLKAINSWSFALKEAQTETQCPAVEPQEQTGAGAQTVSPQPKDEESLAVSSQNKPSVFIAGPTEIDTPDSLNSTISEQPDDSQTNASVTPPDEDHAESKTSSTDAAHPVQETVSINENSKQEISVESQPEKTENKKEKRKKKGQTKASNTNNPATLADQSEAQAISTNEAQAEQDSASPAKPETSIKANQTNDTDKSLRTATDISNNDANNSPEAQPAQPEKLTKESQLDLGWDQQPASQNSDNKRGG